MTEADFLRCYDPREFTPLAVTADLLVMTAGLAGIQLALLRTTEHPQRGRWSLPGGFVHEDEDLGATPRRVLREKVGFDGDVAIEQLATFGACDRDPRMRIITVAHLVLLPEGAFAALIERQPALAAATVDVAPEGRVRVLSPERRPLRLAFDHAEIVGLGIERLRGKLDWSDVPFRLLPPEFTLRALQQVYETVLGRALNKPSFRKRMLDRGHLEATGRRDEGSGFRPAELYRFIGCKELAA